MKPERKIDTTQQDPITDNKPADTRKRILDAAERLFGDKGLDVTFRELTEAANVNVAAIHYHFGSKERLLSELFIERTKPVVEGRLKKLREVPRDALGKAKLEDILDAFLVPALELQSSAENGEAFLRLRARLAFDSVQSQNLVSAVFDESNGLFIEEFCRALPEIPKEEIYWRFHFLLGAVHYTMANSQRISRLSKGMINPRAKGNTIPRLISFFVAGFKH